MPHSNPKKGVTVQDAANELGIGSKRLFALLRKQGYFTGTIPRLQHIKAGLFAIEQRQFTFERSGAQRSYHVALVTPNGMAMINELINKNGNVVAFRPSQPAARAQ